MKKNEFIEKSIRLEKAYDELFAEGLIGVDGQRIHMDEQHFREMFPQYQVSSRGCDKYPFEIYTVIDGIMFFALAKNEVTNGEEV